MKQLLILLFVGVFLVVITSCGTISKKGTRHYEIDLKITPVKEGDKFLSHDLYLDGAFIGNYNPEEPTLWLYPGDYTFKVASEGFITQEKTIRIIGANSAQSLHFNLKKE